MRRYTSAYNRKGEFATIIPSPLQRAGNILDECAKSHGTGYCEFCLRGHRCYQEWERLCKENLSSITDERIDEFIKLFEAKIRPKEKNRKEAAR